MIFMWPEAFFEIPLFYQVINCQKAAQIRSIGSYPCIPTEFTHWTPVRQKSDWIVNIIWCVWYVQLNFTNPEWTQNSKTAIAQMFCTIQENEELFLQPVLFECWWQLFLIIGCFWLRRFLLLQRFKIRCCLK